MKRISRPFAIGMFALLICASAAFAQTPEYSILPVTEPLDVGGVILQPGEYTIRVLPTQATRNRVQITSPDLQTVYATLLTVPHQLEPGEKVPNTMYIFYPAGEGQPRALRTWFAPDPRATLGGHDFIYEESRATQLARLANTRVVTFSGEELADTTELQVVTPQATFETFTLAPPPPPALAPAPVLPAPQVSSVQTAEVRPMEMPRTAGRVPLIALLGLLVVASAIVVRVVRQA